MPSLIPRPITAGDILPVRHGQMVDHLINSSPSSTPMSPQHEGRSVKDDLSEIKNSLTRKFRGVASFLAPPPQTNSKTDADEAAVRKIDGVRSDIAEIGGKVKAGFSKLLQMIPDDGDEYQAKRPVGVTEELLAFVKDLVVHPRTWVRFPLPENANADDFALNDPQQLHVGAVERELPELGDLRWELCPEYLSEGRFWMIYFVLVHPKLDKYDALTLSSPQIVEARALLTQETKRLGKVKQTEGTLVSHDCLLQSMEPSTKDVSTGASTPEIASADLKTQKHQSVEDVNSDVPAPNKASTAANDPTHMKAVSDGSSEVNLVQTEEDDSDDWLNEETPNANGSTGRHIPISNDEDVSFSDLEEDDIKETKGNE